MKRVFGLALVFAAMFAAAAFGAQFGRISIDVADGWNASQDGPTVAIIKGDNSASLSITLMDTEGASLDALAAEWSKQLGGSEPQLVTEGTLQGDYVFQFTNANGVKSLAVISGSDKEYIVIVGTGIESDAATAEMDAMIETIALQ